ncbi:LacI family transcriptional regulator [Kribbella amoyensis]|uniref:LacI family transcriptional regulator n=1 Tax=Kribbella amoyensis TaxID=996641 RepID=A0A561C0T7_9ACTN|nr:LacI family DNA-binding transcriptional regulator [Kribbella amoyensis]TWD84532.1 LacI family transcriptional regulator [Kribbella amoyensis]
MTTQRDIARMAGVSVAVVSAVLNGTTHTRMSEATRARVIQAMENLDYQPNQAARSLRLNRTGMIALILHKLDNPVYTHLLRGVYGAAAERGGTVLLGDAETMRSGSQFVTRLLSHGTVDGILIRDDSLFDDDVVAELRSHPKPILSLDYAQDHPWVGIDDCRAGEIATRFLLNLRHRRIVFIGGATGHAFRQRYLGYQQEMQQAGLEPAPHLATGFGEQAGADGLRQALQLPAAPTAVVVNNVMSAVGVLAAARDLGIAVPDQLSVVGIHDVGLMEHLRPAVTAVRMPMYELGRAGVHGLYELMAGRPCTGGIIADPEPELVVRDSATALTDA